MTAQPVSIAMVLEAVAAVFGHSVHDLRGVHRFQELARARHAACLIAIEVTGFSSSTIGRQLSCREQSTVRHAVRTARELCESDPEYKCRVETARGAAMQLARSSVSAEFLDLDAVATAGRICGDLARAPSLTSTNEIIAMAVRILDLDEIAGATAQLLACLATIDDAPAEPRSLDDNVRLQRAGASARALTETISSALAALGYSPKDEEDNDSHTANA